MTTTHDKAAVERGPALNTDRELWREELNDPIDPGNHYAPSIHVTARGGIGINVGGTVIVKSLRDWHALARQATEPTAPVVSQEALDWLKERCAEQATEQVSDDAVELKRLMLPVSDWSEKLAELFSWTGSAFLAGEKVGGRKAEIEMKGELYHFLCSLIGYLTTAEEAAKHVEALASTPAISEAVIGELAAAIEFQRAADEDCEGNRGFNAGLTLAAKMVRATLNQPVSKGDAM